MRKTLTLVLVFGVLLGVALFAAPKQIVLGKVPITLEAQFHQALVKIEADYAMKKYGATLKVIDGEFKSDVAVNAVYNFISQKVDAIILHTMDPAVLDQCIKAAHDKGIPIQTFYNEPATKANPHVQINEIVTSKQMGQLAAKKWKEFYPNKPIKIGIIDYLNVEHAMQQRSNPFIEGVKSVDPKAEVVSRLDGGGSSEKSLAAAQDMLQAHPEVNIVYGANADHALAALAAFENAGRGKAVNGKPLTEIFVGTDATEAELLKLFNPNSAFKITQGLQPKANAEAEIDTAMKLINKKMAWDKWVEIPTLDILFSYWSNKVEDGTAFLRDQYFMDVDLKAELAKQK
jgi:ABC-type sugar transport system substrate-binding protein